MFQRICIGCGASVSGHPRRQYCDERCRQRTKDRRREASPEYQERRRERQRGQKRTTYVAAVHGTRLCGLCKGPHHAHGLCYVCIRALDMRAPDAKISGTCELCGDGWEKDRKAISALCNACIDGSRATMRFSGRNIDRTARRRAEKFGRIAEPVDVGAVFDRAGWICSLCARPVSADLPVLDPMAPTLEHVIPLSRGGDHVEANCALAHRLCNARKGNRLLAA